MWQFKDPVTSNLVLIGNWPAAVPSLSPDLATKSVRGVLSLIEKSEMEERATALQKVYHGQPYARQDGVVYCHIRMLTVYVAALLTSRSSARCNQPLDGLPRSPRTRGASRAQHCVD